MCDGGSIGDLRPSHPSELRMDPARLASVEAMLSSAIAERVFPGGVLVVLLAGRVALARPFGRLTYSPESPAVTLDTVYDLASLTKVVVTTTLAIQLVHEAALDLDRPAAGYLPTLAETDSRKAWVTVRDLLTHCSGMPPVFPGHFPAYAAATGLRHDRDEIVQAAIRLPLEHEPRTQVAYSDIGVITLGAIVEGILGGRLDRLADERVLGPLGLRSTRYCPPPEQRSSIAPTENDPWRGRVVQGEVHDECAFAMGGVSSHAGLFGSAPDVALFGQALLDGGTLAGRRVVDSETLARFVTRDDRTPGSDRALGWQVAAPGNSAGPDLSPCAFGHTGFTGTSLWIDPIRHLVIVLLTNRVHPRRENARIIGFRPALHSAIARSVVA